MSLNGKQQARVLQANMYHTLMIMFSKLECTATGEEQMEIVATTRELDLFKAHFKGKVDLQKISLAYHPCDLTGLQRGNVTIGYLTAARSLGHAMISIAKFELTVIICILIEFSSLDLPPHARSLLLNLQLLVERKLCSSIRMNHGQSFYWTGLLQSNMRQNIRKMLPLCTQVFESADSAALLGWKCCI